MHFFQILYVGAVVLLLFNFTIFFHELGHFLVARRRGAKVEEFAVWFGPAIWKKTVNGVEYRLGCIPLGGYVKLPQMGEDLIEGKSETPKEEIKPLSPRDKIPILLAGSCANVLFGFFIASLVWIFGLPQPASYFDLKVGYVDSGTPESRAGIMAGDRIKSINGKPVEDWEELAQKVALSLSEKIRIGIERNSRILEKEVIPTHDNILKIRRLNLEASSTPIASQVEKNSPAEKAGIQNGDEILELEGEKILGTGHLIERIHARGGQPTRLVLNRKGQRMEVMVTPVIEKTSNVARMGVRLGVKEDGFQTAHPTPWKQIAKSLLLMADTLNALLHRGQTGVGISDLSGPVGIGWILWIKTLQDLRETLSFLVVLNINLAVINLLPIPVLDGGHILFAMIESITRRPLNRKFVEATQTVFTALLITLMLYITFNDFRRMVDFGIFGKNKAPEPSSAPVFQQK